MPIYSGNQGGGPESKAPYLTGSGAEKVMLPAEVAVSLRYNGDTSKWEYNLHGLGGWVECSSQDEYKPPIFVTRIVISDDATALRKVMFDLSGNGESAIDSKTNKLLYQVGITMNLLTNKAHFMHITKVHLGSTDQQGTIIFLG